MAAAEKARKDAHRLHDEMHRWRDEERARRQGRRPLNVEAIAAAAVAIADAQGVEEVSMRKVAAVLGVGTMSLYHYVRTKEDLLSAMDDVVMGEVLVPPKELKAGWRSAMSAIARATRAAYRRHPWALTIQTKGGDPGLNGLRHVEQSMTALLGTGLDFDNQLAIIIILDDFVFGHAMRIIGADFSDDHRAEALERVSEFMSGHLNEAEFPVLWATIGDAPMTEFVTRMAKAFDPDEWFEIGLGVLLDGLAQRFDLADR